MEDGGVQHPTGRDMGVVAGSRKSRPSPQASEEDISTMLAAHLAGPMALKTQTIAVWLFQHEPSRLNLLEMWGHMLWPARTVAITLAVMSAWSVGVMMDRWFAFRAARRQSRQFAPLAAGALREGKLEEAIRAAERNKRSHLAKVVNAGLLEFRIREQSTDVPVDKIEASKRALERAEAIVHAELERGLSGLATIGSTAPFVGLLGTVIGIIDAFRAIQVEGGSHIGAVSGGISEALVTTALGLFVAIPAVMMFNYFTTKIKAFDVEMDNSSSELIDYLLRRDAVVRR
jgi:biopolymer transport protein ExbB/biopolymer transport protein TolQ